MDTDHPLLAFYENSLSQIPYDSNKENQRSRQEIIDKIKKYLRDNPDAMSSFTTNAVPDETDSDSDEDD